MDLPPVKITKRNPDGSVEITWAPQCILDTYFRLALPRELRLSHDLGIRRDNGLGDVLMTTPALRALKSRYPELRITYYTTEHNMGVFTGSPYVDECRSCSEWNEENHELPVDLNQFVERHPLAVLTSRAELFGKAFSLDLGRERVDCRPDLFLSADELAEGGRLVEHLEGPRIGVAARAAAPIRDWKYAEEALPALRERGSVVWFEWDRCPDGVDVWINHEHTCRQWASVMAHLDVIICTDSGPLHLANAVQKCTDSPRPAIVALLGVAHRLNVLKNCRQFIALEPELPCSPCMHQREDCAYECLEYHIPERVLLFTDLMLDRVTLDEVACAGVATPE